MLCIYLNTKLSLIISASIEYCCMNQQKNVCNKFCLHILHIWGLSADIRKYNSSYFCPFICCRCADLLQRVILFFLYLCRKCCLDSPVVLQGRKTSSLQDRRWTVICCDFSLHVCMRSDKMEPLLCWRKVRWKSCVDNKTEQDGWQEDVCTLKQWTVCQSKNARTNY